MTIAAKLAGLLGCALLLVGCVSLPRGAPIEAEVIGDADDPAADFAVYPVSRAFLPTLKTWPETGRRAYPWIGHSRGGAAPIIRPGDRLDITVWDSGENSLLITPGQRAVNLTAITVSPDGTVFLPYIGEVLVSGRTPDAARAEIQSRLETIIPSAQAQLAFTAGRGNSVDLVGGVTTPGTYPMPDRNYTVVSLIAAGGGVLPGLTNPQVRLIRGGAIYGTSIDRLYDTPALDTRLRGGDQVIVEEDDRYFVSLGAAGEEAMLSFPKDVLTATEALAIIGGVEESRADPQGVLILREYPLSAVQPGVRGPREPRVVFAIDLTTSDGLFSARNFQINSGDLVLATESPITNTRTIFGLIGSAFGVVSSASRVGG